MSNWFMEYVSAGLAGVAKTKAGSVIRGLKTNLVLAYGGSRRAAARVLVSDASSRYELQDLDAAYALWCEALTGEIREGGYFHAAALSRLAELKRIASGELQGTTVSLLQERLQLERARFLDFIDTALGKGWDLVIGSDVWIDEDAGWFLKWLFYDYFSAAKQHLGVFEKQFDEIERLRKEVESQDGFGARLAMRRMARLLDDGVLFLRPGPSEWAIAETFEECVLKLATTGGKVLMITSDQSFYMRLKSILKRGDAEGEVFAMGHVNALLRGESRRHARLLAARSVPGRAMDEGRLW